MKILINKRKPEVRIIAAEILKRKDLPGGYEVPIKGDDNEDYALYLSKDFWKLIIEKPIDLKKEVDSFLFNEFGLDRFPEAQNDTYSWKDIREITRIAARYFYKLARKNLTIDKEL